MDLNYTILIIDDEPNLRRSLGMILQRAGYSVTSAADGTEALQFLQTGPFDLVFLDIKLPNKSGIQLLPEIKEIYPDMPVLILTAHATLDTAIEAVRAGARDYLLKPIDPEDILDRTKKILSGKKHPKRRREITSQIQDLLTELRTIDGEPRSNLYADRNQSKNETGRYLRSGELVLDLFTHSVQNKEKNIVIPPSTFDYLKTLVRHSPNPVSYEKMVLEAQGYQNMSRAEARDITRWQMHELRMLLEPDPHTPRLIITVRGVGYRLVS